MSMTDPIADLLTRIRNAQKSRHASLRIPASKIKLDIVKILKDEGYVEEFQQVDDGKQGLIDVRLKYMREGRGAITGLERISRVGRRVYCGKDELPRVLGGLGVTIVSTPQGVLTGAACRARGVGGEVLCNIW